MTLEVPAPTDGREQVVLSVDEHGIATWHFSQPEQKTTRTVRGGRKTRTYEIPRGTVPARSEGKTRGLIPGLDKVIRVITFPVAKVVGQVARFAAREWDQGRHPHRIRAYAKDGTLTELSDADWKRLSDGPALLFVHGTFSTTEGGFGQLKPATLKALHARYGGRVIAFDHPTIADDPIENARQFFEIAGDRKLELDIVCHSRGGLVSRSIAERPGDLEDLATGISVRTIVLVGVPSNGTILAKAKYWDELLNRMTTLLSLFPGPGLSDTLETVLAVVRSIAVETVENLEGLDAMAPGGDFLKRLNVALAKEAHYRAIVSNYSPKNPGLKAWLNNGVRDAIFDRKPNDMMVTIESMTAKNGSSRFPVESLAEFTPEQAIEHAGYFPADGTSKALLSWLKG